MNSEIFHKVQTIFRDVFDNQDIVLKNEMSHIDIEGWDSLNHITLINTIENEFEIKFALGEIVELQNVGELMQLIMEKLD